VDVYSALYRYSVLRSGNPGPNGSAPPRAGSPEYDREMDALRRWIRIERYRCFDMKWPRGSRKPREAVVEIAHDDERLVGQWLTEELGREYGEEIEAFDYEFISG
jgi:hypothetical protein